MDQANSVPDPLIGSLSRSDGKGYISSRPYDILSVDRPVGYLPGGFPDVVQNQVEPFGCGHQPGVLVLGPKYFESLDVK